MPRKQECRYTSKILKLIMYKKREKCMALLCKCLKTSIISYIYQVKIWINTLFSWFEIIDFWIKLNVSYRCRVPMYVKNRIWRGWGQKGMEGSLISLLHGLFKWNLIWLCSKNKGEYHTKMNLYLFIINSSSPSCLEMQIHRDLLSEILYYIK